MNLNRHKPKKGLTNAVGARVEDVGLGVPLWSPVGGGNSLFIGEPTFSGDPERATIKAHPHLPIHPRPYRASIGPYSFCLPLISPSHSHLGGTHAK